MIIHIQFQLWQIESSTVRLKKWVNFIGEMTKIKLLPEQKLLIWIQLSELDMYIPGTQMTLVFIGKGFVLEGRSPKIEDEQVPGIYIQFDYATNLELI